MTFQDFAQQYKPVMQKMANKYNLSAYEKDEVVQESLLHLMRNWEKVNSEKSLNRLCLTVISNHVKMETRGSRSKYFDCETPLESEIDEDIVLLADISVEAVQQDALELSEDLKRLSLTLSDMQIDYPEHVKILRLILDGNSLPEAAEMMSISYQKSQDLLKYSLVLIKKYQRFAFSKAM